MATDPIKALIELHKAMASRAPRPKNGWYEIKSKDGGEDDTAEIRIYDYIDPWGITAEDFVTELDQITASNILVAINSGGGDYFDSLAIYNALRLHTARVTTRVDALAASGASVIAQAGDQRIMVSPSEMMIHKSWGILIGNADDARKYADLLDRTDDTMATIYSERAGDRRKKSHFMKLMADTTWLTHDEAVTERLADEVLKPEGTAEPVEEEARAAVLTPIDWDALIPQPSVEEPPGRGPSEQFYQALLEAFPTL